MRHIASVSFGKDSLCMLLRLIETGAPLDEVVFYDTGKEFQAIYNLRDKIKPLLESNGISFIELKPLNPFDYDMFDRPIRGRTAKDGTTGYGWCGGTCRWGTTGKIKALETVEKQGDIRYIGIASDEPMRLEKEYSGNKRFPLAEWGMTERDCLEYCYLRGYNWNENGIELYSILDRVSCWCCRNKNLKELKGIFLNMPDYWQKLKDMQARLPQPMKGPGKSVLDLEKRFIAEFKEALIYGL